MIGLALDVLTLALVLGFGGQAQSDSPANIRIQDTPPRVVLDHQDPAFKMSLPRGYQEFNPTLPGVDLAYRRFMSTTYKGGKDAAFIVSIQFHPDLWERSHHDPAELARLERDAGKNLPPGATVRLTTGVWSDRVIDVFESRFTADGMTLLSLMAEIPLAPRAIQLTVSGFGVTEESVHAELKKVLAGISGESNETANTAFRIGRISGILLIAGGLLPVLDAIVTAVFFRLTPGRYRRMRLAGLALSVPLNIVGGILFFTVLGWANGIVLLPILPLGMAVRRWTRLRKMTPQDTPQVTPPETDEKRASRYRALLGGILATGGLGTLLAFLTPATGLGWWMINWSIILFVQAVSTIPYCLGHALVARAVGFQVVTLAFGTGAPTWKIRLGHTRLELRPLPIGATSMAGPLSLTLVRSRLLVVALSGAFAIVAVWALVLKRFHLQIDNYDDITQGLTWGLDLSIGTLILLILNLFPRKIRVPGGTRDSDGIKLLRIMALSQKEKLNLVALTYAFEGSYSLDDDRPEEALQWYDRGLLIHPQSLHLRNDRPLALIALGRLEEAKRALLGLLREDEIPPIFRALALNNIAHIDLLSHNSKDLLEEADRYSEEALKLVPGEAAMQSTRGAVLVERDRIDEGVALLKKALEKTTRPRSRAAGLIFLGLAHRKQGNVEESRSLMDQARALDPKCPYLARLESP